MSFVLLFDNQSKIQMLKHIPINDMNHFLLERISNKFDFFVSNHCIDQTSQTAMCFE